MPFQPSHRKTPSTSYPRSSMMPSQNTFNQTTTSMGPPHAGSTPSMSAAKSRQYAHLHSQLAQLNANLADTENLLRMTAVQAGDMRFLGGYIGGMFMGSAKILGEEGVKGNADPIEKSQESVKKEDSEEE
ncbi:uncharacterized protein N7483_006064 [Penicillium malachiteum]|uniref:uncharacterized protein n=1 Tax=Penicillium malachiteum TaxID=1324776 RepID=UPI0025484EB4|nr:uncharacterized protein N7483_006064 [Penicillium malachiteum]KAJ5731556.1 hypothetical protein N7483_006064 [Penicillium malachiteum]